MEAFKLTEKELLKLNKQLKNLKKTTPAHIIQFPEVVGCADGCYGSCSGSCSGSCAGSCTGTNY